jgi:rare lipoprotein A
MHRQITVSGISRTYLQHGYFGLTLLLAGLINGCASEPTLQPIHQPPPSYKDIFNSHKAPYNRPYKVRGKTYYPLRSAEGYRERGIASWYGSESGNRTAMGTRFKPSGLSAAHKTLPLPSRVRVTNLRNGLYVDVLVNDRGPFKKGRLIDLSEGAAKKIGLRGQAEVEVRYLENQASINE